MTAHGWPDGARAACAFTFDLDAETLWMARGVTEPVALSQGRFGPVEALPKILDLLRAAEIHSTFFVPATGRAPLGYRAPAWQLSSRTLGLLLRYGFAYSSNMMDRLSPYLHEAADGGSIVEIPVSWVLDDAPYFLFTGQWSIQAPGPVLQGWLTELDGICDAGGVANCTFHPQLIGRPSRLACLAERVEHARRAPRVW